jgi:pyrrolidone-carboxylate peptidase
MISIRLTSLGLAACLVLLIGTPAAADPDQLDGTWRRGRFLRSATTTSFSLQRTAPNSYQGLATKPRSECNYRLSLTWATERWELSLEREVFVEGSGITDRLDGTEDETTRSVWRHHRMIALEQRDDRLVGCGFSIQAPTQPEPTPPEVVVPEVVGPEQPPVADGSLGDDPEPEVVVHVLITGFDRFPRPRNHPRWLNTPEDLRTPMINPSGWVVRNFDPETLDPELRRRARIVVHQLTDVPVHYVAGAAQITAEAARVDADVVISFGVGANSGADADVETRCSNVMDDSSEPFAEDDHGPFHLPDAWPPARRADWSDEDQLWAMRYPDNAGVSYNGAKIDEDQPEQLTSTLPVQAIVDRVKDADLRAIDGGYNGPGTYICNNVMFKVIQTQTARGGIGGFIHLASWSERRQDSYHTVARVAIEESVRAYLDRQDAADLATRD